VVVDGMIRRRRIQDRDLSRRHQHRLSKGGDLGSGRGWRVVLQRATWQGIASKGAMIATTVRAVVLEAGALALALVGAVGGRRVRAAQAQQHDTKAQGTGPPVVADAAVPKQNKECTVRSSVFSSLSYPHPPNAGSISCSANYK
jgi:hypothetical protein